MVDQETERQESSEVDEAEGGCGSSSKNGDDKIILRSAPLANRLFWSEAHPLGMVSSVWDRTTQRVRSTIGQHVIAASALNEVASQNRNGFFFYLKSRDCYIRRPPGEKQCPRNRVPPAPGPHYPTLLYMPFNWSDGTVRGFRETPHRGRYLACNAGLNPPPPNTQLYVIQYIRSERAPTFKPLVPSIVIFSTPSAFYAMTSAELEAMVGLRVDDRSDRSPKEPKLAPVGFLWKGANTRAEARLFEKFHRFKVPNVQTLYTEIIRLAGTISPSLDAQGLSRHLPRPEPSEDGGVPLGRPMPTAPSADVTMPRRERQRGGHRKRKRAQEEQEDE